MKAYIYAVLPGNETPDEPRSGWYLVDDEDQPRGPFSTREEAQEAAKEQQ